MVTIENNKYTEALGILNTYDRSEKSAQDAQTLIHSMETLFSKKKNMFRCSFCNQESSGDNWDETTEEACGEEIYSIMDIEERDGCVFNCPNCNKESNYSDIKEM